MKKKKSVFSIIINIVLLVFGLACLYPILNTLAISLSDRTSAALGQITIFPKNFNTAAYKTLLEEKQFMVSFFVSVKRVLLGTTINMVITILMAYPLSKSESTFKARKYYIWIVVFTMMFNGGLVPTFILIKNLNLIDTIWALVLPCAVPVFNVILLMNFFRSVPNSLEEAALIDGASVNKVLWQIYVPLSKAALATILLFSIVKHWNSFFDGKIYINSLSKMPLQTYIQSLIVEISPEQMMNMAQEEIDKYLDVSNLTFNSAKVIVSIIPVLVIYPFIQRYFVTGIVLGSVKE